MKSVENEGMKLYSKLEQVQCDRSTKLQTDMEDCESIGAYILDQSLRHPRVFKIRYFYIWLVWKPGYHISREWYLNVFKKPPKCRQGSHSNLSSMKEELSAVSDKANALNKIAKFKKIDGKAATYGAQMWMSFVLVSKISL